MWYNVGYTSPERLEFVSRDVPAAVSVRHSTAASDVHSQSPGFMRLFGFMLSYLENCKKFLSSVSKMHNTQPVDQRQSGLRLSLSSTFLDQLARHKRKTCNHDIYARSWSYDCFSDGRSCAASEASALRFPAFGGFVHPHHQAIKWSALGLRRPLSPGLLTLPSKLYRTRMLPFIMSKLGTSVLWLFTPVRLKLKDTGIKEPTQMGMTPLALHEL